MSSGGPGHWAAGAKGRKRREGGAGHKKVLTADSRLLELEELVAHEAHHEAGLPYRRVAQQHELEVTRLIRTSHRVVAEEAGGRTAA